jgi:hypothetical protein
VTLASITALPSSRAYEPPHKFSWRTKDSILSSFLPNPQGHGPLGVSIRVAIKLRHQSWLPRFLSSRLSGSQEGRRSDEELRGRAIKVMDLLQHAADLGHLDAFFTLGKISLVFSFILLIFHRAASFQPSFHLLHTSLQTLYLRIKPLRPTLPSQEMQPRKDTLPSFMQLVTRTS